MCGLEASIGHHGRESLDRAERTSDWGGAREPGAFGVGSRQPDSRPKSLALIHARRATGARSGIRLWCKKAGNRAWVWHAISLHSARQRPSREGNWFEFSLCTAEPNRAGKAGEYGPLEERPRALGMRCWKPGSKLDGADFSGAFPWPCRATTYTGMLEVVPCDTTMHGEIMYTFQQRAIPDQEGGANFRSPLFLAGQRSQVRSRLSHFRETGAPEGSQVATAAQRSANRRNAKANYGLRRLCRLTHPAGT
jgi:hypothetical protein